MTLGFLMLCHTALDRAAQVARHWAEAGCPIVIHVDSRVPKADFAGLKSALADLPHVSFSRRFACEWGTWSLVKATQAAAEQMLSLHGEVRHVFLASGSCLPLRPVAELRAFLDQRPRTDFIESVTTADVGWTVGGLDAERFTLSFHFPFRKRRALFDASVAIQRRLGLRRKVPEGLVPHLGSQWWCLTRQTLSAILEDRERARNDRYFRRVWIPDESYFQTLARRFSTDIESRSLTLSKFDWNGKPHCFYDDHLQLLRRSDCFIARKIWPQANRLYDAFLSPQGEPGERAEPNPGKIDRLFAKAVERRTRGRAGLYMQSRFPRKDRENGKTCAPYSVFQGFTDVFDNFEAWLSRSIGGRVHGHLFAPDHVGFAGGEEIWNGAIPASVKLRDYNPRAFLTNLIWSTRGERQCFQFSPRDNQANNWFMATDPNAQISVVTGAWAIRLFRMNENFSVIRKEAARLQKIEMDELEILRSMFVKARVRIWTLADFLENPMEHLQTIADEITPRSPRRLAEAPRIADMTGFGQFLQNLRNQGMQPVLMGDFPVTVPQNTAGYRPGRPYIVR
jgi:hypothetical protein